MTDQLQISNQVTLPDTPNATSLQELVGGLLPCNSLGGQQIDLFGLDRAPASHSVAQENKKASQMNGTSGLHGSGSSKSAALQQSLVNKLQARLPMDGWMKSRMTWKTKVTPSGRQYCQLAVSARHIDGTDCGLWLTPRASLTNEPPGQGARRLGDRKETTATSLSEQVAAMWPTPTSRDHKDGSFTPNVEVNGLLGRQVWNGSPEQTENRGQLCPEFVCWLMGFPNEWLVCMVSAMQSYRKSRPRLSKRT